MSDARWTPDVAARAPHAVLTTAAVCCWLLMLLTFSAPERIAPSGLGTLDAIGLAKLAGRGVVGVLLLLSLFGPPARREAVWGYLAPFTAFAAWAVLSVFWSPARMISLGQAGSLLILVFLAAAIATNWRRPADTSRVWMHLSFGLLLISSVVLAAALVDFESSGLDRHGGGLMHATNAAATASLGIVTLITCTLIWPWRWAQRMLAPGVVIHGALLLLACNRTALVLTILMVLFAVALFAKARLLQVLCFTIGLAGCVYLLLDPGLVALDEAVAGAVAFSSRGQTEVEISSFSGRWELWGLLWQEYLQAPWIGHGYFVCTESGYLDVWGSVLRPTAHNLWMQVLCSTGIVGLLLFVWAVGRPVSLLQSAGGGHCFQRTRTHFLTLLVWYLGWGMLSESIAGPLQPESVVFFAALGLAVAPLAGRRRTESVDDLERNAADYPLPA